LKKKETCQFKSEAQIETEPMEELKDLTSVNIMRQKQQLIETQMIV